MYNSFIKRLSYNTNRLIKSLSGLLQKFSCMPLIQEDPNSIIEMNCDLEGGSEDKCKMIIPGFMDHDSKQASKINI